MRKSHWENLQTTVVKSYIDSVKKSVSLTNSMHKHPADLAHIDCVYNHIEKMFPEDWKQGNVLINPLRAALFYSMFSGKIYKVAEEFSKELSKVNIQVKAQCIPADNEVICIELPEWPSYQACYIGTTEYPGEDSIGPVYRRIELQFCNPISTMDKWDRVFLHFHSEEEIIEDAVNKLESISKCELVVPTDLLKFVINSYLYIHSGSPDLRNYSPPKRPLTSKPKVQRRFDKMMSEQSSIPITIVGFNFKKSSEVSGHFQGYWTGSGRKSLVLKWKDPYEKGGKNEEV